MEHSRGPWAFLVIGTLSCAGPATEQQASVDSDASVWCLYDDKNWWGLITLHVRGGGFAFSSHGFGNRRTHVTGRLVPRQGRAVFETTIRGAGLTVDAEADATVDRVLYANRRVDLGDFGLMLPHTSVHVSGGTPGELEIGPDTWSLEGFRPVQPVRARVRCEDTTIHEQIRDVDQPSDRQFVEAGFPKNASEVVTVSGAEVPLHATPGGEIRGHFLADKDGHFLRVIEKRGDWSRVVEEHWMGVFWFGWVQSSVLRANDQGEGGLGLLGGLMGGGNAPAKPPPTRCAEPLDLVAEHAGASARIGRIEAQTPFRVLKPAGAKLVQVELVDSWLAPDDGVSLQLPVRAKDCPKGPATPAPQTSGAPNAAQSGNSRVP